MCSVSVAAASVTTASRAARRIELDSHTGSLEIVGPVVSLVSLTKNQNYGAR